MEWKTTVTTITCIATCFGFEDPGDDGHGSWGDDNNNTTTVGVSIPIPILRDSFGLTKEAVKAHTVTVEIHGVLVSKVPITDAGPGIGGCLIWGRNSHMGHLLDLTSGLCAKLKVRYNPNDASYIATYSIEDQNGHPIEILGLDSPKHYVND